MIARFAADAELGSSAASAAGSPDQLHPVRCRRSRSCDLPKFAGTSACPW